jgi:hypothetical protein
VTWERDWITGGSFIPTDRSSFTVPRSRDPAGQRASPRAAANCLAAALRGGRAQRAGRLDLGNRVRDSAERPGRSVEVDVDTLDATLEECYATRKLDIEGGARGVAGCNAASGRTQTHPVWISRRSTTSFGSSAVPDPTYVVVAGLWVRVRGAARRRPHLRRDPSRGVSGDPPRRDAPRPTPGGRTVGSRRVTSANAGANGVLFVGELAE